MTSRPRTAEEWRTLLRARIDASGLSVERFAKDVLVREPSTVRRWLRGGQLPRMVRDWLMASRDAV